MRPYPPYPSEDEAPAGPPWVQLLPSQRAAIDESTTEVPVITPDSPALPDESATASTAQPAGTAEPVEHAEPAEQAEPVEPVEPAEQAAPAAHEDDTQQATDSSEVGMQAQQWAAQPEATAAEADPQPAGAGPAIAISGGPAAAMRTPGGDIAVEAEPAVAAPSAVPSRRPGEVAESPIAIWSEDAVTEVRAQWSELQSQFIDDPQSAVDSAKDLVAETVRTLSDRLLAEQSDFDPYRDTDRPDTETMRVAMRRYREFLDRILAL